MNSTNPVRWPAGLLLLASLLLSPVSQAFDYWVLALSWSPEFCKSGRSDDAREQCSLPRGFIVHGLWPQNEAGYPEFCSTTAPVPDALVVRMAPLMPDAGLVQHQWKKHGSCSGLDPDAYFTRVEQAMQSVMLPDKFMSGRANQRISKTQLEKAFLELNAGWAQDAITIECRSHYLTELRLCLDQDLKPRACGADVGDVCERELIIRPRG
ncbi:MAG: ribonuclease T2 family protein [Panacagrimonas sp.]